MDRSTPRSDELAGSSPLILGAHEAVAPDLAAMEDIDLGRGLRTALITIGGLFLTGTLPPVTGPERPPVEPIPNISRFDAPPFFPPMEQVPSRQLLQNCFDPNLSNWERRSAERELALRDPGGARLLELARSEVMALAPHSTGPQRAALELFIATRELGLEFPERFDREVLPEIIRNRQLMQKDDRPLAVVIYPKGDFNGAFYAAPNIFSEMVRSGHRLLVFEAECDSDFISCLRSACQMGTENEQQISLLVIGGHGSRTMLTLERDSNPQPGLSGHLDLSDEQRFKEAGIAALLTPGGQVILDSCSNGEGRAESENMANLMRKIFPHARQGGIWAATESYGPLKLHFNSQNALERVEFPVPTYRAHASPHSLRDYV